MGQAQIDSNQLHQEIDALTPAQQAKVFDFVACLKNKKRACREINDETEEERKAAINTALQALVDANVAEKFGDPAEWQREIRKDRPLPGRG